MNKLYNILNKKKGQDKSPLNQRPLCKVSSNALDDL